ncbi:hypothetical protein ABT237_40140 [Streptomyces sp. NPDC001581]|uniref:hypothetical protein n=1 Tax=Streptomyces sp. NPDC001581 TaxID=3154386 RepID=UPI0033337AB0
MVRPDFARDEWLPEPPVLTAIPRGDGTGPTVVRTASRELSLAWKLLWLHAHCAAEGRAQEWLQRLGRALEPVWGR